MSKILAFFGQNQESLFAIGIIFILAVLVLPLPSIVLDIMLGVSITFAVVILVMVLFIEKPLEFSSFPSILLIATMIRLSLNVASTRLILSNGHEGTDAAGDMIQAFGGFVMSGSVVIGIIVFGILTIINFMVITKGSGRIAEVSARFSLDAMPGKQMSIDADLSAGIINDEEARTRRKTLEDESNFYGSMDGANKFVRGDAIAGLMITFINFIAGIVIGTVERDMVFNDALNTYTILTIGDGLVSQIPSLMVSIASGLLVTKSGAIGSTDKVILGQIRRFPNAIIIASAVVLVIALVPGINFFIFFTLSLIVGSIAYFAYKTDGANEDKKDPDIANVETPVPEKSEEDLIADAMKIDTIRLELGYDLLTMVNAQSDHKLSEQIQALRRKVAQDLGFVIPKIRIQDNVQISKTSYNIMIKEMPAASGEVFPSKLLIMNAQGGPINIPGTNTQDPSFGLPAKWVENTYRKQAMKMNYTVIEPSIVITTHLVEIIKEYITDLLSYSETKRLLNNLSDDHQKLLEEIVPSQISVTTIEKVLQGLLSEAVSIRDLNSIIESLAEIAKSNLTTIQMIEYVRYGLRRQISNQYINSENMIEVLSLSSQWEKIFHESMVGDNNDQQLALQPGNLQNFLKALRDKYEKFASRGEIPVLIVSPTLRPYVRSIIERYNKSISVLSQREIDAKIKIKNLGFV